MHTGFIAVKSTVGHLADELASVWPELEVVSKAVTSSFDDFQAWQQANKSFVSARDWSPANPGVEVYGLLQCGPWAVLLDSSCVLPSDEVALAELSQKFGRVVSFVTETSGGYAAFMAFTDGTLTRRVSSTNGEVVSDGAPLEEETGLDMQRYYVTEAEELQRRLGVGRVQEASFQNSLAIAVIDRTDYTADVQAHAKTPARTDKPWWRFW